MSALSLNLDTWDLARHYEAISVDRQFETGKMLVQRLGVQPGDRVLDVGCGTGLLAEHVADIVGPEGSVVALDPLRLRVEIARQRSKPHLTFRVGDGHDLSAFGDSSFDVVYLNEVFHWLVDKRAALREVCRVLPPGGRLGITTGSAAHPGAVQEIRKEVLSREAFRRYPQADGVAQWVDQPELERLLADAGFCKTTVLIHANRFTYRTADDAIEFVQASSFGNFLGHLPESARRTAREEIKRELERRAEKGGIQQDSPRLVALAVKKSGESP